MGAFALVFGLLGALCAVMGILTTIEVFPPLHPAFTWELWFSIAAILLLGSIASKGSGGYD
ncbi:hypothetical protein ACFLW8_05455 [Chloroflexota bacterium]